MSTPPAPATTGRSLQFWKRTRTISRVGVALCLATAVFLVAWSRDDGAAPVLPDTEVQFSLDLSVVGAVDVDTIYVVEQRARPAYRIFAFEPATGQDTTVFTVPEDAIIYGITLSPDRETLAVAYSPDFHIEGSGIWTLDLDTLEFAEVVSAEPGIYLTDPEFTNDGATLFTTHVDRRGAAEQLSIVEIDMETGTISVAVDDAINPAVSDETLFYLKVDEDQARRSIGTTTPDGDNRVVAVGDGSHDLDHLVASADGLLYVAVLEDSSAPVVTVGETADAHGNHNVASTWWNFDATDPDPSPTSVEPIVVYDASTSSDGTITYATLTGLAVANDERTDVIASRAIRFVAS